MMSIFWMNKTLQTIIIKILIKHQHRLQVSTLMTFLETQFMLRNSNMFQCIYQMVMIEPRSVLTMILMMITTKLKVILLDLLSSFLSCPRKIKTVSDSQRLGGKTNILRRETGRQQKKRMKLVSKASFHKILMRVKWVKSEFKIDR